MNAYVWSKDKIRNDIDCTGALHYSNVICICNRTAMCICLQKYERTLFSRPHLHEHMYVMIYLHLVGGILQ